MLRVRDIMTRELVKLTPETTIREAMETLSTKHLSGAPVVSGGLVVGIISMTDILDFIVAGPEPALAERAESLADAWGRSDEDLEDEDEVQAAAVSDDMWDELTEGSEARIDDASPEGDTILDQRTVEDAMTRDVISILPGSSARAAATIMNARGIHRILVMQGKSLVGIVSALDIARAVSETGTAEGEGVRLRI